MYNLFKKILNNHIIIVADKKHMFVN